MSETNQAVQSLALPYHTDSREIFQALKHLQWPLFLHSSSHPTGMGRFDIIAVEPSLRLTAIENTLLLHNSQQQVVYERDSNSTNPFDFVTDCISLWRNELQLSNDCLTSTILGTPPLPGAYGYFGYDISRQLEQLPHESHKDIDLPELALGLYDTIIVVDHHKHTSTILSIESAPAKKALSWTKLIHSAHQKTQRCKGHFKLLKPFALDFQASYYEQSFKKIAQYITEGDCYQINFAQRFGSTYEGEPWQAYCALSDHFTAPFSGYFDPGFCTLMSLSPEQLLSVENNRAQSKPIKGTSKREADATLNAANIEHLKHSEKDQAENLMIVDLIRNDFSKICTLNSVQVEKLFELETFANVHHLVSTVSGILRPNTNAISLLKHCFPGGSITGAPKIRAMEIIDELEQTRRSVYCGSLGYWDLGNNLNTNILIRTFLCRNNSIYCWAGSGIVADSNCEAEYQETFDKVLPFTQLLETMID